MSQQRSVVQAKLRKWIEQWPALWRALELVWTAARGWTAAWLVLLAIQGILPIATVYLTRTIVNGTIAAIRAGGTWESLRPLIESAALLGGVLLAVEALRGISGLLRVVQADLVQDHISSLIQQKSASVDLAFYESPRFYDHLHRARQDSGSRPLALVESLGNLFQNCITLLAMLAVLIPFGPWLPAALLLSATPALYVVLRYAVLRHHWLREATTDERWSWYYEWLLTAGEAAAEIRLFGLGEHFRSAYAGVRLKLREGKARLAKTQAKAEVTAGLAGLLVTAVSLGWMGYRAVRGLVTLGDLALFYQAFQQGQSLVRSLLDHVGQIYQNSLFLGNLFEFLSLEPEVTDPERPAEPPELRDSIRFRNVTFGYPTKGRAVLEGFNLTIPAGQVVTIVGPNGAGKSTLIKLLCRFYDPQQGSIEWDGADMRSFSVDALRRRIAALFQQPVHYWATLEDNIRMGDLNRASGPQDVVDASRAAGADQVAARLAKGYGTLLGSWFADGTEISVGEWQRIALARAFWRHAPLVVFDEPTSAMDPWAEAEWLSRFRELVRGRTALIITHRFTTARFADVIHVISDGRIVESGNHQELLTLGGMYARGWTAQTGNANEGKQTQAPHR